MGHVSHDSGEDPSRMLDRADAGGRSDRLLRAVQELRALDREKHEAPPASKPFHELTQRLELKVREVFRIAVGEDEPAEADRTRRDSED
jgi:hypothetical protein